MTYALIVGNAVQSEGGLPSSARRLDTQQWVMGLPAAPAALQQACGYYQVVDTAQPADTSTDTFDRSVAVIAAKPTVVWTQRPMTGGELAARATTLNSDAIAARVQANISALQMIKNSSNTLTAVQLSNAVRALAAAQLDLARVLFGRLDAID